MLSVDRKQVLAYRIAAQGLHREAADPAGLAVLDLGIQDNQRDSGALAMAARVSGAVNAVSAVSAVALADDPRFGLAWSHRGAPHWHRKADLAGLASALVPLDDADAQARMGWQRRTVAAAGMPPKEALLTTAKAIREAVDRPMTKGAASTIVTGLVPAGLSVWCRPCGSTHVLEQLMRLAAPIGGVRLVAGAAPATLAPLEDRQPVTGDPDMDAATTIVVAYLSLHGPATAGEAAGFVGTTRKCLAPVWPDGLAEVSFDSRNAFLPADRLSLLENPPEPAVVRLLPPSDPLLQGRDRLTLVPDKAQHKEIWKILGNPGAVLADGELAGTWRAKTSGKRLRITVSPFWNLPRPVRERTENEAERVAAVRGYSEAAVDWA
ncbi:Winged helix DNA-binding domain-containing protein [Amycolatopsis marina]|uniref:Winged helix DNA-binding domain-containing protein n=1 Tax=Amycolatopsis marina TaxID=490629 RepID=A0A1I1BLN5_9PSEU|nr:crosslink repair DNA glycosylase YcaQ family protein [Amycolatopsis marina]SFB51309.1 Winged helix DNA-binding domain-containing protein [Amycolatopsis marina]